MTFWEKTRAFCKKHYRALAIGAAVFFAAIAGFLGLKRKVVPPAPPTRPDARPQLREAEDRVREDAEDLRDAQVREAQARAQADAAGKLREFEDGLRAQTPSPTDLDAINLRADQVSPRRP